MNADNLDTTAHALQVVAPADARQLSLVEMKSRMTLISEVMHAIMIPDVHYGVIPGTDKPTLLKAGAEVLGVAFRLAPRYQTERADLGDGHREYTVTTQLYHQPTGQVVGEGIGSCSTKESKYRYRYAARTCPNCGQDAIARSKPEYGGGWYCNPRRGGCNAKYGEKDDDILKQQSGRIENPDIADQYNTVLKMAIKRSHIAAIMIATAAGNMFTTLEAEDETETEIGDSARAGAEAQRQAREESHPPPATKSASRKGASDYITQGQIGFLMQTAKDAGVDEQVLADYLGGLGIESRKDIPVKSFEEILAWVRAAKADKK